MEQSGEDNAGLVPETDLLHDPSRGMVEQQGPTRNLQQAKLPGAKLQTGYGHLGRESLPQMVEHHRVGQTYYPPAIVCLPVEAAAADESAVIPPAEDLEPKAMFPPMGSVLQEAIIHDVFWTDLTSW
jgi:hypothetical protein